ncbi:ISL3 family transposase [Kitasatospora sp. NPDC057904]|uniref:ISL3 family transposase n=1 Tax=Kitasatospora sp. NPDC057904 TaxID=3346275 RepID=UPI0036DEC79B
MTQSWSLFQELLFPSVPEVALVRVEAIGSVVRVEERSTADDANCPDCGVWSSRVHGSCLRFPADLPSAGRRVVPALRVRRFACPDRSCPRRTSVEQIQGLTRRHGQSTERLRSAVTAIGPALAGRAGERLVRLPGLRGSRSTLPRRVMEIPDLPVGAPAAIGADGFALRRGHVHGTVITDAVTHRVLDLLPDRDAATPGPWPADHPQVEVICRDRASAYAEAADTAAPQARQIADRYHLWHNLTQAVERTVLDHRACLHSLPLIEPEPEPQRGDATPHRQRHRHRGGGREADRPRRTHGGPTHRPPRPGASAAGVRHEHARGRPPPRPKPQHRPPLRARRTPHAGRT